MVLITNSPRCDRRNSFESSLSYNRSSESLRSGYVLPHGEEPERSLLSKCVREVILCGCILGDSSSSKHNTLTNDETEYLEELRGYLEEPFDSTNADHEMLLTLIWQRAFPGSQLPHPVDPLWTKLGFQSANPRTDIRTGVHSLRAIEYMSRAHESEFRRIVYESSLAESEYPFSASCVSVAFSLVIFFRLNKRMSVNPSGSTSGTKLALKQFVRLSMHNPRDAMNEIFSQVVIRVHNEWMKQPAGEFDIHYFATALQTGIGAMATLFNERRIRSLTDLAVIQIV